METNTTKHGDELNEDDSEHMLDLMAIGNKSSVEDFLAEKGASVNTSLFTEIYDVKSFPLHAAVDVETADYHPDLVKYFISEGADCNVLDGGSYAPLHYAAIHHNMSATKTLLEAGADVNLRSNADPESYMSYGSSMYEMYYSSRYEKSFPLHLVLKVACHNYKHRKRGKSTSVPDLVQILMSHGADCNLFDNFGPTPLHCAVQLDDIALARLFLDAGANVNSMSSKKDSVTPIFNAESVSMLKFLLSENPNAEIILENGNNILLHSISKYRIDVIGYIVSEMPELLHTKNDKNMSPINGVVRIFLFIGLEQEKQVETEDTIRIMMKAGCDPVAEILQGDYMGLFNSTPSGARLRKDMEKTASHPRSLLDLCAIHIRSVLKRNISSAVESLPQPTKLKQTLTLVKVN